MSETVISPCIGHCRLNEQQVCMGCYRTLEEITGWRERPDPDKAAILVRCNERKQQHGS